ANAQTGINLETYKVSGGGIYSVMGSIDGRLYIGSGSTTDFIPGGAGGSDRTGWIDRDHGWFLRKKATIGNLRSWDGAEDPNPQNPKDHQLEVFGHTNLNGHVYVNGYKPIWVRNYFFGSADLANGVPLIDPNDPFNNPVKISKYGAAIISGFEASETLLPGDNSSNPRFRIKIFTYQHNGNWYIKADFPSVDMNVFNQQVSEHEEWNVVVTFIATELVQYDGNTN
ncbi:MAG: hypothetical protein AAFO69_21615, partial [Bacteroidota bacterium]